MYFISLLLKEFHIKEIFDLSVRYKEHTILQCSVSMATEQPREGYKEKGKHTVIFPQYPLPISHKI